MNKQYNRTEYETLIPKIRQHMDDMPYTDRRGRVYRFGEFFPTELSAYAYNESFAYSWYPKTKEEVQKEGWAWREPQVRSYRVTMNPGDLPDHIRDVSDAMLGETIGCLHGGNCADQCATAFRITPEELVFYREMNIALPRLCPNCRSAERMRWRNGFRTYQKQCDCAGANSQNMVWKNTMNHAHGAGSCPNRFETTFLPEKPEIVYCGECYKAEFL